MKNKMLIILLLLVAFNVKAQQWGTIGSKWYYSYASLNPNAHDVKIFESVADTVINGFSCYKILERYNYIYPPQITKTHYMFSRNDSVFFYANGTFNLLYDFGAQPGDTILLPYYHSMLDNSILKMIINSVSTININGHSRIVQYVTCGDGISIEFGPTIIEGIGSTFYMFPTYDMTYDGPLRCYEDTIIGHYQNPYWSKPCDTFYFSGINENAPNVPIQVYPNPASNEITIETQQPCSIEIFDIQGQLLKTISAVLNKTSYDISELPAGLYFLKLSNTESNFATRFVKD